MNSKNTGNQVVDRHVRLLEAKDKASEPVSLKYLTADTGLHPSFVFCFFVVLLLFDLVEKNPNGSYELGRRLLRLAQQVPVRSDLREVAKPILNWLRDQTGETVNLTVREGDEVIYVERALPNRMMRVEQIIGSRAPLHVTAVGKLMLAESGDAGCRAYARRTGLPPYTVNTLVRAQQLIEAARLCQGAGYAYDDEEAEMGVGCIGVLVRNANGEAVAGLSISAPRERRRDSWIPLLQEAGERLSQQLGHLD